MIAIRTILILTLCLGLTGLARAQEPRLKRVEFEPGTYSATIQDRIRGYDVVRYQVGARAGQTLEIGLETNHGATYFNVLPAGWQPGRDAAAFVGETGGSRYRGTLATDGEVLVEVYMMRSAARRNEIARYTLRITIEGEPRPSPVPPPSGPWPIATDASGDLPCTIGGSSFERDSFDGLCPFRVARNEYGATIWVVSPREERAPSELEFEALRTIYFEGRQPNHEGGVELKDSFSTNDSSEVRWDRHEDAWIVSLGDGDERYWIPDAVIWGG